MSATAVLRLTPDDAELAGALAETVGGDRPKADDMREWLAEPTVVAIGAWVDAQPAGFVWGHLLPRYDRAPMLLLYSIDVAATHRQAGIGTALIEAMRTCDPGGGMWVLTNEANRAAIALYAGAGATRPHADDVMFRFPRG